MITPGIDEFTLVIQPEEPTLANADVWEERAPLIAEKFIEQTHLNTLFGNHVYSFSGSAGYTDHITYANQPFGGFNISWHSERQTMGIVIAFSASSWLYYRKFFKSKFGIDMTVVDFLLLAQSKHWESRLSRIDFYTDYKDEGISVNSIYNSVERKRAKVIYSDGRQNKSKHEVYLTDGEVKTYYLGSRSKNTRLRFRLYDKKYEQISKGSSALHLFEAKKLDDWVRLEVSFKKDYAHQLHESLLKVQNHNELKQLILGAILEKYQFIYIKSEKQMKITKGMNDLLNTNTYEFVNPNAKVVELEKMIDHQLNGSGLFSLMHKIEDIFGKKESKKFIDWLYNQYYQTYEPTKNDLAWLNKFKAIYQLDYKNDINKLLK